jgi:hypothetical protein
MVEQPEADAVQAPTGAASSRALTVVAPLTSGRGDERPASDFLAQLIACNRRVPAYRAARKADPARAVSAYAEQPGSAAPRLNCLI